MVTPSAWERAIYTRLTAVYLLGDKPVGNSIPNQRNSNQGSYSPQAWYFKSGSGNYELVLSQSEMNWLFLLNSVTKRFHVMS